MEEEPRAERLNSEVIVWKDCTVKEVVTVGGFCFLCTAFICCLITMVWIDRFMLGIVISTIFAVPIGSVAIRQYGLFKRDKPRGYSHQCFWMLAEKMGMKSPYLSRNGKWSVARK